MEFSESELEDIAEVSFVGYAVGLGIEWRRALDSWQGMNELSKQPWRNASLACARIAIQIAKAKESQ